jgi:RNA polymerase sigma-70 factor (ECF subfamily)
MGIISEEVKRLKTGSEAALEECMLKYQDYVYSLLLGMLTREEAQEAAQDTFIKVFKSVQSFNGESKFSTWIYRIAYRTGLDYLKKRKNVQSLDEIIIPERTIGIDAKGHKNLEKQDVNDQIESALLSIPADQSTVLRLFYLSELNLKEVADITGLTESNVKVRLFRARKQLKKQLELNMNFTYY